ncbi:MAG: aspartate/glutamate racemase family protein, partial [Candidatus Omnitrophica bacterium]|nr:aspartate/glutamate racemase family protein [Candidatus Omnitrophota bacterium]
LPQIIKEYKVPILGVLKPGAHEAVIATRNNRIGVIGTNSTINSGAYEKEIQKISSGCRVFSKSCPLFVPLVENNHISDDITCRIAEMYLGAFKKEKIDTLILGCTHYPILKGVIAKTMKNVALIDSATSIARVVKHILHVKNINNSIAKRKTIECHVSDDVKGFKKAANIFLNEEVDVKKTVII